MRLSQLMASLRHFSLPETKVNENKREQTGSGDIWGESYVERDLVRSSD